MGILCQGTTSFVPKQFRKQRALAPQGITAGFDSNFKKQAVPSIIADCQDPRCYHFSMIHEGTTERLILRPLETADAAQIQELFPHWEIVKYMLNRVPWPYPEDGALQFIREIALPQEERGEAWHWTLRPRSRPSQLIGVINLTKGDGPNRGFWLAQSWQGQGLMSEAAAWANDYWFETLGFPVLRVAKAVANAASQRISEKQGMRLVGLEDRDYVSGRLPSERWEITAEEWRNWKSLNQHRP
jgi:RimJ/RimL family protein N-acetyltransferase